MAGQLDPREIVWKIYEKITPNLGLTIAGPQGALAASALVVATWLLLKLRGAMRSGRREESDEEALVRVYVELEEARRRLEEARGAGAPQEAVKALEARARWLEEEYQLIQVRIAARDTLKSIAGDEAARRLEEMVKRLEEGQDEALGEVARLLAEVEALWRRRELEAQALKRLLEAPA